MMQNVNTVLVSNIDLKTSYANTDTVTSIPTNEIFLEDQNGTIINEDADLTAAKAIRIGLKTAETLAYTDVAGNAQTKAVVKYTPFIQKGKVRKAGIVNYSAPVEDSIVFDFTGVTPVVGNRYVIRFIYRDLYEHPGQFTKSYEFIATTTVLADLIDGLAKQINKDATKRISIVKTATSITATALAKTDNEGKESINVYTKVSMTAVAYFTNPNATGFASKVKQPIASLDITKTAGNPGKGFWKQVRDAEQAALAYKGITYRTSWPYSLLKPAITADSTITYDSYIIEFENSYLTPDNQLNSTTRQSVELYYKAGATRSIETWLNTFTA